MEKLMYGLYRLYMKDPERYNEMILNAIKSILGM